jgi:glycosyltransferase involved in cell wall biosynthesis
MNSELAQCRKLTFDRSAPPYSAACQARDSEGFIDFRPLMQHLSVVFPLYNEERCLEDTFKLVTEYLDSLGNGYEVILVNDGSNDKTPLIIKDIARAKDHVRVINNHKNRGKGHAVRCGVLKASKKYVVFSDADLAVPVHFIKTCLQQLAVGAPVVIGSRHLAESSFKVREGPIRQVLGETFRIFTRLIFGLKVSDITCGMKGFEKTAAADIFSRSIINRWGYDAEILFLAQKLDYAIAEIPVDWSHSFDSKVSVGAASIRTFMEMFQIFYNYQTKRYNL